MAQLMNSARSVVSSISIHQTLALKIRLHCRSEVARCFLLFETPWTKHSSHIIMVVHLTGTIPSKYVMRTMKYA